VIPIVSVVGKSDSGKTTLVEELVAELTGRGYRVGTVKHSAEKFSLDVPGKDSYRHHRAGAVVSAVVSSNQIGVVRKTDSEPAPDALVDTFFKDMDIVVTEGYTRAPTPKIVVQPLDRAGDLAGEIIAEIGDGPTRVPDTPRFESSQTAAITDLIEARYLTGG